MNTSLIYAAVFAFLLVPSATFLLARLNRFGMAAEIAVSFGPLAILMGVSTLLTERQDGAGSTATYSIVTLAAVCSINFYLARKLYKASRA